MAVRKWNLYDEGIRVPLVISWPGNVPAGAHTAAQVSWIDLFPTLIEAAGGTVPATIFGRSFASLFSRPASDHRDHIFTSHDHD